jgi:hypothetical protein
MRGSWLGAERLGGLTDGGNSRRRWGRGLLLRDRLGVYVDLQELGQRVALLAIEAVALLDLARGWWLFRLLLLGSAGAGEDQRDQGQ